jgi:hypothetical protein
MAHRKLHGRGGQLDSVLVIHVGEATRSGEHFVARCFYREISDLVRTTTRVSRTSYNTGRGGSGRTTAGDDVPILRPEEIRLLPEGKALVTAESARPLIA